MNTNCINLRHGSNCSVGVLAERICESPGGAMKEVAAGTTTGLGDEPKVRLKTEMNLES